MSKIFTTVLLSAIGFLGSLLAQNPACYSNASMEGNSQAHTVPAPWQACYGSPDTQPGQWGINLPASNGNTYVSFLHAGNNPNGYKEGMTQLLNPCLVAGNTYTISVDLAHSPIYNTAGPGNCPSSFAMYAGTSPCAIAETLYTSGPITHTGWQTYNITFTPTQNYCYISFAPYHTGNCSGYINILIDNFSCVQNALVSTAATDESCPGACDGMVVATTNQGTPPFSFSWSPGGSTNDTIQNLCPGTYTVTVTDANGTQATSSATVGSPPAINLSVSGQNISCNGGSNGSVSANASGGSGPLSYLWSPGGSTSSSVNNLPAGTYVVTVTDTNNCSMQDSITLTEPSPLAASINVTTPLCPGTTSAALAASGSGGTPGYQYAWSNNQTGPNLNNIGQGFYLVTVTDANGCTAQDSITLNPPSPIQISGPQVQDVSCFGAADGALSFNVAGGTGNLTYAWTNNGSNAAQANNLGPGNYTMIVTDGNGCVDSAQGSIIEPPVLNASITSTQDVSCFNAADGQASADAVGGVGPYTFVWANNQTGTSSTGYGPGNFWVVATDQNGCTDSAYFSITEPSQLTLQLTTSVDSICDGQSFNANAAAGGGTAPYQYLWSPAAGINAQASFTAVEGPMNITSTVTDANGCLINQSTVVRVGSNPQAGLVYQPVCLGNPIQLTSQATNSTGSIIMEEIDPGDGSGSQTASQISHIYNAIGPWNAQHVVQTEFGCVDTVQQPVLLFDVPQATFSVNPDEGCAPLCPQFTDNSTVQNATIAAWNWTANGVNFAGTANPSHCFENPGSYQVGLEVTSSDGCTAVAPNTHQLTVHPNPVAAFSYDPAVATMDNPLVTYENRSDLGNSFLWTFFDGSTQTGEVVTYNYLDTGRYCVTLQVTTEHGCIDDVEQCSPVRLNVNFHVPNTFTPNIDGLNERFRVYGTGIEEGEMWIFDRWGVQLFYTKDIEKGWDGRNQREPKGVAQGVYVYKIDLLDSFGELHTLVGKVNLLR